MAKEIQKEVAARLDPEELALFQNVISQDTISDELDDKYEDYEDADAFDESDQESPTPAVHKGKGPLARGEKVLLSIERSWTAMESDEAYQATTAVLTAIAQTLDSESSKAGSRADWWWKITNEMRAKLQELESGAGKAQSRAHTQKIDKAIESVTGTTGREAAV